MSLINRGIRKKLIQISEDGKQITYLRQRKRPRTSTNPEEIVQVETYLKLIFDYNYKPERIKLYELVKMGSGSKEADIIVYNDDECTEPYIVVECKKQEVSEAEFQQAIEQAYSYAYALPNNVKYLWVTSGIKNEYYEVNKNKYSRVEKTNIPKYGVNRVC
jgi:type I restriction enzyme M protein